MEKFAGIVDLLLKPNREKSHKVKPSQFVSVAGGIKKRLENNLKYRKSCRITKHDAARDLSSPEVQQLPILTEAEIKVQNRKLQLEKWKQEKEAQKKAQTAMKKKPFLVGVYRAPLKFELPPIVYPSTSGRVTRSQQSKLLKPKETDIKSLAPKNAKFNPPKLDFEVPVLNIGNKKGKKITNFTFNPIIPKSSFVPNVQTRSQRLKLNQACNKEVPNIDNKKTKFVKENISKNNNKKKEVKLRSNGSVPNKQLVKKGHNSNENLQVITKEKIPKSESKSEEKLRSPKSQNDNAFTPLKVVSTPPDVEAINQHTPKTAMNSKNISPCVIMSRGKDNARKEMKKKLEEGLLDEDVSDANSVQHFRCQLASEINRMTEMCLTWDNIFKRNELPNNVQELVLAAVGQARLLMSQKLQQFASLVERCALPAPGTALVTPRDLLGFWDMVFKQIEDVDLRFKYLEDLQRRNWVEKLPSQEKEVAKKNVKKSKKPVVGTSKLKDIIAAARKAHRQPTTEPSEEKKIFEAGFFYVKSPVRQSPVTPVLCTPKQKNTLLKTVLSSEARKASASKNSTSYAMLRASMCSKYIEIDGVLPLQQTPNITPVNLKATPARSILKSTKEIAENRSAMKCTKTVLFNYSSTDSDIETNITDNDNKMTSKVKETKIIETPKELAVTNTEKDSKKRSGKKSKLSRQDAIDTSPILTRRRASQRKSIQEENTVELDIKSPLQTIDINIISDKKSKGRKSKGFGELDTSKITPRRSSRIIAKDEENVKGESAKKLSSKGRVSEVENHTPKRMNSKKDRRSVAQT